MQTDSWFGIWDEGGMEGEKAGLKLNIQKTKVMTSSPITAWQIDGVTMETVINFILGGSKITAVVDCSHEIIHRIPRLSEAPWQVP